jgi:hypothetical protein
MRFMVLVKATADSEAGVLPTPEMFAAMGKFNEELVKGGIMLAGEGLHPSMRGARIQFSDATPTVINGPFPANELVCGFWMLQAKSRDEVLDWMKRAPFGDGAAIEIRQVFEAEDFGAELTPELREQEERLRAQSEQLAKGPKR